MAASPETESESTSKECRNAAGNRRGMSAASRANLQRGAHPVTAPSEPCAEVADEAIPEQLVDMGMSTTTHREKIERAGRRAAESG
jgi:hypothetical protein